MDNTLQRAARGGAQQSALRYIRGRSLGTVVVREAADSDSEALLKLVGTPTETGGVRWTIDRQSDFFIPFRAEAGGWWVLVAEQKDTGALLGCVSVVRRDSYVDGRAQPTCYVSNLLVRAGYRRQGIGDELCRRAADLCRAVGGDHGPVLLAIREGNAHMRRRIPGPRGLPGLRRFAQVRIHSIRTHLLRKSSDHPAIEIRAATPSDLEDMAALSQRIFAGRQFAPTFDAESLERWIAGAADLAVSDHLVARESGTLIGWLALWDESVIRRVWVAGYSRTAAFRAALHNACARGMGAPPAPRVGDLVTCSAVVHPCIPQHRPELLRSILEHAAGSTQPGASRWLRIALDPRDRLTTALTGLRTQVSPLGAYVSTPGGPYAGPPPDDRPLHFEAALA